MYLCMYVLFLLINIQTTTVSHHSLIKDLTAEAFCKGH